MMFPTPLRTRDSAAQEPTPPRPITATEAEESLDMIVSLVEDSFFCLFAYSLYHCDAVIDGR